MSPPRAGWRASAARGALAAAASAQAGAAEAVARVLGLGRGGARSRGVSCAAGGVEAVARAVVLRPDELGDIVLTGPFLRELRRLLPRAHITLVVKPAAHPLVERCPHVDAVRVYPARQPRRALRPVVLPVAALRFALATLRPGRPDLVVLPRWDADQSYATFVARWTGAPWVVGYSEWVSGYRRTINRGFDRLLTHALGAPPPPGGALTPRHEVERALDVVRALGGEVASTALELWLDPADRGAATAALAPLRTARAGAPIVAIGLGAGHAKRRWPAARYAAVARALQTEAGAAVAVIGGPADVAAQRELLAALGGDGAVGLAGTLTLRQTAAALAECALYVGNDSGPMHIAAAAGVPVVELSCHPRDGSPDHENAPERFGPWGVPADVVRPERATAPCRGACTAHEAHCILQLSAEEVARAAGALLRATSARAASATRPR